MVVLVMDQYSSVLKSSWHSTHFWSPQEQVKVKIPPDRKRVDMFKRPYWAESQGQQQQPCQPRLKSTRYQQKTRPFPRRKHTTS